MAKASLISHKSTSAAFQPAFFRTFSIAPTGAIVNSKDITKKKELEDQARAEIEKQKKELENKGRAEAERLKKEAEAKIKAEADKAKNKLEEEAKKRLKGLFGN
jgi:regulator of protease activity HflC (stomatin/prohibitin superfamily)